MQLDEEGKRLIYDWLESKLGVDPACRMCGSVPLHATSVSLLPSLQPASPPMMTIDRTRRRDNITVTSSGQAVVNVQCRDCGYVHLFDVAPMGVSLPLAGSD